MKNQEPLEKISTKNLTSSRSTNIMAHFEDTQTQLLSGVLLARNTTYNILGQGIPLIVALLAVPLLLRGLGVEQYGMLTLVWVIVDYFNLFDLGLSRATTKFVADCLVHNQLNDLRHVIWTAWFLLVGLGVIGTVIFLTVGPWLTSLLMIPYELTSAVKGSWYWLALSIPIALGSTGALGVLQAQQRFDLINAICIPAAIANHAVPLLILLFSRDFEVIVAGIVMIRSVVCVAYVLLCIRTIPSLRQYTFIDQPNLKRLLGFGGWLTVSGVVGPFMVYLDRFLIGGLLGLSAVAYYTTPYNVVTRLWLIPASLLPVLFPALSSLATLQSDRVVALYHRATKYVFLALLPIVIFLMVFSRELLMVWIGSEFAEQSAAVFAWLSLGVLVNSLAQVPYTLIQAAGRPDVTAKFHLLEVFPYVGLVWFLTQTQGIVGTAIAWVVRVSVDGLLLFLFANHLLPEQKRGFRFVAILIPIAVGTFLVTTLLTHLVNGPLAQGTMIVAINIVFGFLVWHFWLDQQERVLFGHAGIWLNQMIQRR